MTSGARSEPGACANAGAATQTRSAVTATNLDAGPP